MHISPRSFEFDRFLDKLRLVDIDRYRQLVRAETLFTRSWYERLVHEQMLFDEQLQGFEETPAGPATSQVLIDSTDWSWKPHRDKRLGDDMVTFRGVPKGAAELYGPRIRN